MFGYRNVNGFPTRTSKNDYNCTYLVIILILLGPSWRGLVDGHVLHRRREPTNSQRGFRRDSGRPLSFPLRGFRDVLDGDGGGSLSCRSFNYPYY